MSINTRTLYGRDLTLRVALFLYEYNEDKTDAVYLKKNEYFDVDEWRSEAENNKTMLEIKQRLLDLKMIEL